MRSNDPMPDDCLTIREAAALLRVCTKSIRRWMLKGQVRAWRVGRRYRISRAELLERVAQRVEVDPAGQPIPPTRREIARHQEKVRKECERLGIL